MQDLHQLAGGNRANSSASRRVCHHSDDLWTPSRGRVYSQGLLREAEHVWVRITECQAAKFGGAVIFGIVHSRIAKYSQAFLNEVHQRVAGTLKCLFSFTGKQRTLSALEKHRFTVWLKKWWGQNMLLILTDIAMVKWLKTEGWAYFLRF